MPKVLHIMAASRCPAEGGDMEYRHWSRIDMVMKTDDTVYLFELKLNRSAEEALAQIERKNYSSKFFFSGLPVVKVGINFSNEGTHHHRLEGIA